MQAYSDIHNLVESVQRYAYLSASLPSSLNCVHEFTFIWYLFCKGRQFHQFGSQSSGENHSINNLLSSLCLSCFSRWYDMLPCYFVGIHFVCINASPGHKLIFRQLIACPNNVSFTKYNNSQCICSIREWLAIFQWHTLTPSWSLAQVGCIFCQIRFRHCVQCKD